MREAIIAPITDDFYNDRNVSKEEVKQMSREKKCLRCGSTKNTSGWMQSTGKLYFRPDHVKFLTAMTADISVNCSMCLECGAIEMAGDLNKAQSLNKSE